MQSRSVDSPVQNRSFGTRSTPTIERPLAAVSLRDMDIYAPSSSDLLTTQKPQPTLVHLEGALGRPQVTQPDLHTAEACFEQARCQFAAGRSRQGVDMIMRAIGLDNMAIDEAMAVLWDQPQVSRVPLIVRTALSQFRPGESAHTLYQWVLVLAYHAAGNRQYGMRFLGQAIAAQAAQPVQAQPTSPTSATSPTSPTSQTSPTAASSTSISLEPWLRRHGMAAVSQVAFWQGVPHETPVGEALSHARRSFLNALNLADTELDGTLPLVNALVGAQREVLATLEPAQVLRLLALHARGEAALTLRDDDVHAMLAALTLQQRLDHLGVAVEAGQPFHVSAALASGVTLADVRPQSVGSKACRSPYIVEQLLESGTSCERLADIMVSAPVGNGRAADALPTQSLDVLLRQGLSVDYRVGGQPMTATLLEDAIRRKDTAAITVLRGHGADCNLVMRVVHPDGAEGFTTPGLMALAQGDAQVLRAIGLQDAKAVAPGIDLILKGVKGIA